jgi:hypothetical protein
MGENESLIRPEIEPVVPPIEPTKDVQEILLALDSLSVMERLHFVKRMLFNRAGPPDEPHYDKAMAVAAELMEATLRLMKHAPREFHEWDGPRPL